MCQGLSVTYLPGTYRENHNPNGVAALVNVAGPQPRWGCVHGRSVPKVASHSAGQPWAEGHNPDRKSTRLNSSHLGISYAVFCLKKNKKNENTPPHNAPVVFHTATTRYPTIP